MSKKQSAYFSSAIFTRLLNRQVWKSGQKCNRREGKREILLIRNQTQWTMIGSVETQKELRK